MKELKEKVDLILGKTGASIEARVHELHRLCGRCGFGTHEQKEARAAGLVKALVDMALEGFPDGGDLERGSHPGKR